MRNSKLYKEFIDEFIRCLPKKYRKKPLWQEIANNVLLSLKNGNYFPLAPEMITRRDPVKIITIAKYFPQDMIVFSTLYAFLAERLKGKFNDNSIGGFKGHSRHDFLNYLDLAKSKKLNVVLITDIADFFASIEHNLLKKIMRNRPFNLPVDVCNLVIKILKTGNEFGNGIFIGNPLGKLLGNIYLTPLDNYLSGQGVLFVRYIDDVCIFIKSKSRAEELLAKIKEFVSNELKLALSEPKTGIYHRYYNKFEFLGFSVIGNYTLPSDLNIERFRLRLDELVKKNCRKGLKKFLRKYNSVIYNFAHQYKKCSTIKLFTRFDEIVRARFREYLILSRNISKLNSEFVEPSRYPKNLSVSSDELYRIGLASLVDVKLSNSSEQKNKYIPVEQRQSSLSKNGNYRSIVGPSVVVIISASGKSYNRKLWIESLTR